MDRIRKIGEVFDYVPTGIQLEVRRPKEFYEFAHNCDGCYFFMNNCFGRDRVITGSCIADKRPDGPCIFKEKY
jgi:hypothetical protein